jgi:predicted nucleic acid-binding protein
MADALFDTTVFIDYYKGDSAAHALMQSGTTASYSAITQFEVWAGITTHEEEIDYLAIMAICEEAVLTSSMARAAAQLLRQLTPSRSEGLFRDALIAATAMERGETIYTRNARDFRRFNANVRSY